MRDLMAHQKDGIEYCRKHQHPALIWEMRLGKTLTTIRWLSELEDVHSILILAPLTVLEAWDRELRMEGECVINCYGLPYLERCERIRLVAETRRGRRWLLANYELLLSTEIVCAVDFDAVIADESIRFKNAKAKTTKLMLRAFRTAKHRAILTGMPNPESDLDLFTQFAWLRGQFMGHTDFWHWRAANFVVGRNGFDWLPKPGVGIEIKQAVHDAASVLRRRDVAMDCRKVYERRYVTMTPAQSRLYREAKKDFAVTLGDETRRTNWMIVVYNWLTRITGGFDPAGQLLAAPKKDALIELMTTELKGEKVVIWCKHTAEIEYLAAALRDTVGAGFTITGQTPQEDRKRLLEAFRTQKNALWIVAQVKCAKYGIDCSTADTAIYYSNTPSCDDRVQSEDRILHPMKKTPLLIVDLVCRNTIDVVTVNLLAGKRHRAKVFMTMFERQLKRHLCDV